MEREEDRINTTSNTNALQRQVSMLQNQLMVAEVEKDAALEAADEEKKAHQMQGGTPQPDGSEYNFSTSSNNGSNYTEVSELRETVQQLLQQLEEAEDEHQEEQNMLQEEVLLLRKKLERLESQYIVVERARDDALQKLEACRQQLEVEKALNSTDLKRYQLEIRKWRDRCEQELRFSVKKSSSGEINKTAASLGSRLGAGILEGVEEEVKTTVTGRSMDEMSDGFPSDFDQVNDVASTPNRIEVTANFPINVSSSDSTPVVWMPEDHEDPNSGMSSNQAFKEPISIPNFLSKVW